MDSKLVSIPEGAHELGEVEHLPVVHHLLQCEVCRGPRLEPRGVAISVCQLAMVTAVQAARSHVDVHHMVSDHHPHFLQKKNTGDMCVETRQKR